MMKMRVRVRTKVKVKTKRSDRFNLDSNVVFKCCFSYPSHDTQTNVPGSG